MVSHELFRKRRNYHLSIVLLTLFSIEISKSVSVQVRFFNSSNFHLNCITRTINWFHFPNMFFLIEFIDGIKYICPKSRVEKLNKNDKCIVKYKNGTRYPAKVLRIHSKYFSCVFISNLYIIIDLIFARFQKTKTF